MKRLILLALLSALPGFANTSDFDWTGLDREIISLGAPLLIVKASKGFIGCGYINVNACLDLSLIHI